MPLGIAFARGHDERRAEVVPLDLDVVEELGRDALAGAELRCLGEGDVLVEMAVAGRRLLAGLRCALRELGIVSSIPNRGSPSSPPLVTRLPRGAPRAMSARQGTASHDRLHGVEGPPAGEDGERAEHAARRVVEQVVAPVDRRAQRALPLGQVARAARQQREALVEPLQQLRSARAADAGGGQLDGQRQPVQAPADPATAAAFASVSSKPGRTARARSTKSRTASRSASAAARRPSGTASGGTWYSRSRASRAGRGWWRGSSGRGGAAGRRAADALRAPARSCPG